MFVEGGPLNPCGTNGLRSIILDTFLSPSFLAGRPQGGIPTFLAGHPPGVSFKGKYVGRQTALGGRSRRGRGGAGWCGAPCGCPCCPHLCARLQTPPRAATRAPSPYPFLPRPYANHSTSQDPHNKPTLERSSSPPPLHVRMPSQAVSRKTYP